MGVIMVQALEGAKLIGKEEAHKIARRVAGQLPITSRMPSHERARILMAISEGIKRERQTFATLIAEEVGKPLKAAFVETDRCVFNFSWAAAEAQRFGGEWMPVDLDSASDGRLAFVRRFPKGACLFICPFNFPLNLVAHKVAPAIAVGAPFMIKPAPQAPRTAAKLAEIIREAGWPDAAFAVVDCDNDVAESLVTEGPFEVVSFTGSAKVGWHLKDVGGRKYVALELGGNAGAVVAADADVPWAAARCAAGAYAYAGQVCISVQRIFVEEPVYDRFKELFIKNARELVVGDVMDPRTDVGPLIDDRSAQRVEDWIKEAVAGGGTVLFGGKRTGRTITPALVENAPKGCKLACEEAFGPVATIEKTASVEAAVSEIAKSEYGLQAGLFTQQLGTVFETWETLPVGGLIVNDIPTYRSDAMPYGGVKASGVGREGVRYAMEEYTDARTLVVKP
jgi:acyl-CoA reductase-like NAD-dependent aldehyde dehydrogenase